jgi:hypothetical protein
MHQSRIGDCGVDLRCKAPLHGLLAPDPTPHIHASIWNTLPAQVCRCINFCGGIILH